MTSRAQHRTRDTPIGFDKPAFYSKAKDHSEFNAFLGQLTQEQRELVTRMLLDCRSGAIHDVLAALEWWRLCGKVEWTFKGEKIPLSDYDEMHMDYISRTMGHPWPGEKGSGPPRPDAKPQQELDTIAEADAKITSLKCPHCGRPCPAYRRTCKHCKQSAKTV